MGARRHLWGRRPGATGSRRGRRHRDSHAHAYRDADTDLDVDVDAFVLPLVGKNGNTPLVECPDDLGAMQADQTKVRQALFNLLSNAAKFTDHGTISLTARREGDDWLTFAVADTGIGMTEEQLGRLFEAFSRAEAPTRSRYGGTGLARIIHRRK